VVAWDDYRHDGSGDSVFGRRFDATGAAVGGEFQVNSYTTRNQHMSTVVCDATGNFVVAWRSDPFEDAHSGPDTVGRAGAPQADGKVSQDGSESGIFAQLFGPRAAAQAPAPGTIGLGVAGAGLLLMGIVATRRRRRA